MRASEVFRERVKQVRKGRGWFHKDVAEKLEAIGAPMGRRTLSKLENGTRSVTLDEVFEIAAALDVAPVHLMVPIDDSETVNVVPDHLTIPNGDSESVKVVPNNRHPAIPALNARAWVRGHQPLPWADVDDRHFVTEVPDAEFRLAENTSYRWVREFIDRLPYDEAEWTEDAFLTRLGEIVEAFRKPRLLPHDEFVAMHVKQDSRDLEGK